MWNDVIDDSYYLAKYLGFTYMDITLMTPEERRYYLNKLKNELEKQNNKGSKDPPGWMT